MIIVLCFLFVVDVGVVVAFLLFVGMYFCINE